MAFDPYESWLGITAADRPPTYYRLLGLSPFESNLETIERAALRRMGKVRQYQIGPHSDLSQEILAELARARLVLIDPDRRADYDAMLRSRALSRPDLASVVEKGVVADVVIGAAPRIEDGLEVLAKLRTGDDNRADVAAADGIDLTGIQTSRAEPGAHADLNFLATIAQESKGSPTLRITKKKRRILWKNKLFVAA
jgi:curved DNA-binding protein CbpA